MSRRDTILIAVLINVGLLVILFATARSGEEERGEKRSFAFATIEEELPLESVAASCPAAPACRDEIDQALQQHRFTVEEMEVGKRGTTALALSSKKSSVKESDLFPRDTASNSKKKPVVEAKENIASEREAVEISVKPGDSLDKIARANGTTVDKLMKANSLKTSRLQIGQKLTIPAEAIALAEEKSRQQSESRKEPVGEEGFYTIRSGDSPWSVAMKFRIPLDELLTLNHLNEDSARKLKPGDRIRIR